jgi:hypothetical protein
MSLFRKSHRTKLQSPHYRHIVSLKSNFLNPICAIEDIKSKANLQIQSGFVNQFRNKTSRFWTGNFRSVN